MLSLLLIRHGVTEMNEYLATVRQRARVICPCAHDDRLANASLCVTQHPYGSGGFVDPGLYDTRLTLRGKQQAIALQELIAQEHERAPIDLCIASPLSRALETADLALGGLSVRYAVSADIAERRCERCDRSNQRVPYLTGHCHVRTQRFYRVQAAALTSLRSRDACAQIYPQTLAGRQRRSRETILALLLH